MNQPLFDSLPNVFDLTHPKELFAFGQSFLAVLLSFVVFLLVSGIVLSVLNFSFVSLNKQSSQTLSTRFEQWVVFYGNVWKHIQYLVLVFFLATLTFFWGATLANRHHRWEQNQLQAQLDQVEGAGARMEQATPKARYSVSRKYKTQVYEGSSTKPLTVEKEETVNYYVNLASSTVDVHLKQISVGEQKKYQIQFEGLYEVENALGRREKFVFEAPSLMYYLLLKDFKIEQDGRRLNPHQSDSSQYDFWLDPGEKAKFKMTYEAQGDPRWVYTAYGSLLSNFKLTIHTHFSGAEFASGIQPESVTQEGGQTIFVWAFKENVSVQNPFGIFTAARDVKLVGLVPRILHLSPVLLLGWLFVLYLTVNLNLKRIITFNALFISALMTLTYLSRLLPSLLAWGLIALVVVVVFAYLYTNEQDRLPVLFGTILAFIIPIAALLLSWGGIILSLSVFSSAIWVMIAKKSN